MHRAGPSVASASRDIGDAPGRAESVARRCKGRVRARAFGGPRRIPSLASAYRPRRLDRPSRAGPASGSSAHGRESDHTTAAPSRPGYRSAAKEDPPPPAVASNRPGRSSFRHQELESAASARTEDVRYGRRRGADRQKEKSRRRTTPCPGESAHTTICRRPRVGGVQLWSQAEERTATAASRGEEEESGERGFPAEHGLTRRRLPRAPARSRSPSSRTGAPQEIRTHRREEEGGSRARPPRSISRARCARRGRHRAERKRDQEWCALRREERQDRRRSFD